MTLKITSEILAKISQPVSGHAMKVAIDGTTPEDISKTFNNQGVTHRVLDAQDAAVFDDKAPTIVSGLENLSPTAFACFVSQMDSLRFRNILIFPTKNLFTAEECELTFNDRMGQTMMSKFKSRVQVMDLEGF
jgi:hypothetical protein